MDFVCVSSSTCRFRLVFCLLTVHRGHVCLIVNVASKCGFTESNQSQLQALHEEFAETKGLRILAFPCNQFGGQVQLVCAAKDMLYAVIIMCMTVG